MQANLEQYAAEIRETHAAVLACDKNAKDQKRHAIKVAIACGQKLIEAKKMMEHGQWRGWLADNCKGVSAKTATNYMRLANAEREQVADLSQAPTLRQAYIAAGIVKNPERPEPNEFTKAKKFAHELWELLHGTPDPERMANEIQPVLAWYQDFVAEKQKREAALHDGFEMAA